MSTRGYLWAVESRVLLTVLLHYFLQRACIIFIMKILWKVCYFFFTSALKILKLEHHWNPNPRKPCVQKLWNQGQEAVRPQYTRVHDASSLVTTMATEAPHLGGLWKEGVAVGWLALTVKCTQHRTTWKDCLSEGLSTLDWPVGLSFEGCLN